MKLSMSDLPTRHERENMSRAERDLLIARLGEPAPLWGLEIEEGLEDALRVPASGPTLSATR